MEISNLQIEILFVIGCIFLYLGILLIKYVVSWYQSKEYKHPETHFLVGILFAVLSGFTLYLGVKSLTAVWNNDLSSMTNAPDYFIISGIVYIILSHFIISKYLLFNKIIFFSVARSIRLFSFEARS